MPASGSAGARRAAALLSVAMCAEAAHATMDEEGAKVDLKLGLRHAHIKGTLLTVHCQVKEWPFLQVSINESRHHNSKN